jgi:phosphatidylglycerol---prolipoprotein diacylglyceryl transferase
MYPVLFEIGGFEITSFGAMVALAAFVGLLVFQRELRRSRLPDTAADAAFVGLLGGLAGAKLLWVLEYLGTDTWTALLFSRAGLSWFGGFAGGLLAAIFLMRRRRLPLLPVIAAATPALAIGHAIGRIGCLLVGDDYGTPSTLPWAMAFPQGLPPTDLAVHPTQIYEAVALVPIAMWLFRLRRRGVPDAAVVGTYLLLTASVRFLIQWIRLYDPVVGPLGFAHIAALVAMAAGAWLLATAGSPRARAGAR